MRLQRSATVDDLGLEQADHRLGERVVVAVPDAADGRFVTSFGQALGVASADILGSPIGMLHEPAASKGLAFVKGPLKGIEDDVGPGDP